MSNVIDARDRFNNPKYSVETVLTKPPRDRLRQVVRAANAMLNKGKVDANALQDMANNIRATQVYADFMEL